MFFAFFDYKKLKKYPKLLKIISIIALKIPVLKRLVPSNDTINDITEIGDYNDTLNDVLNPRSKLIYAKIIAEMEKIKLQSTNSI